MTRVVLVTGANRGIGRELARQLALRGDTVVLTARDLGKAERAAAALPGRQRPVGRRPARRRAHRRLLPRRPPGPLVTPATSATPIGGRGILSVTDVAFAGLDDPALIGEDHQLGTVAQAELGENARHV